MYNKPVIFCVDDEIIIALGILRGIERHFGSTFCYEVTFDPTDGLKISRVEGSRSTRTPDTI